MISIYYKAKCSQWHTTHLLKVRNWQQMTESIKELRKQCLQITVILSAILGLENLI